MYGLYWLVPVLVSGVPAGALGFQARDGSTVTDTTLLRNLRATDTTLSTLDFEFVSEPGDLPVPVCMVARELGSNISHRYSHRPS